MSPSKKPEKQLHEEHEGGHEEHEENQVKYEYIHKSCHIQSFAETG